MLTLILITAIVTTYFIVRFNELESEPVTIENSDRSRLHRK